MSGDESLITSYAEMAVGGIVKSGKGFRNQPDLAVFFWGVMGGRAIRSRKIGGGGRLFGVGVILINRGTKEGS